MEHNIIEIVDMLRRQYLTRTDQKMIITVMRHGFMVERKPLNDETPLEPIAAASKPYSAPADEMQPVHYSCGKSKVPSGSEILNKSHTSKWWSRYHMEKNLAALVFNQLGSQSPSSWFQSTQVAREMSRIMGLTIATCKKHITRSLKMGILVKRMEGANHMLALNKPEALNQGGYDTTIGGDKEVEDQENADTAIDDNGKEEIEKSLP